MDTDHLGRHVKSCHGKCENCRNQGITYKKPRGKWTSCEVCKGNDLICGNFSHSQLAKEAKRICEQCDSPFQSDMGLRTHIKGCKGKCKNCRKQGVPCMKGIGKGRQASCKKCRDNCLPCEDFSHSFMVEKSEVCERYGLMVIYTGPRVGHFRTCRGKCKNCWDRDVPCRKYGRNGYMSWYQFTLLVLHVTHTLYIRYYSLRPLQTFVFVSLLEYKTLFSIRPLTSSHAMTPFGAQLALEARNKKVDLIIAFGIKQ
jgi:hypothetical protein